VDRAHKEPTEREKKESKCPSCGHLWPKQAESCPACGHVREKRNLVHVLPGQLEELVSTSKSNYEDKQMFYSELKWIARDKNYSPGWVAHKYREKFGVWPRNLSESIAPPTVKTINWIKSRTIAWAKKRASI